MFETIISVNSQEKVYIEYLISKINGKIKQCDGIAVVLDGDGRTWLSIAIKDEYKQDLILIIKQCIAEVIIFGYKRKFFIDKINFDENNFYHCCIIDLLCYLDFSADNKQILSSIGSVDKFSIDGFVNFKMNTIKSRWKEVVEIMRADEVSSLDDLALITLMVYLKQTLPTISSEVQVHSNIDKFEISNSGGTFFAKLPYFANNSIENETFHNIIAINPDTIIIDKNLYNADGRLHKILEQLFSVKCI